MEYVHISSDKPVDIRGYNTMASLRSYKMSDAARLVAENDTIAVYDEEDVLVYQKSYDGFLDGQLRKVGLSQLAPIPESVYPDLLRIDMDSSAIILEAIDLRRDSSNRKKPFPKISKVSVNDPPFNSQRIKNLYT